MSSLIEPEISESGATAAIPALVGARRDVLKRYAWLVSGSVYYAAVQWIVLTLLARTLGAASVGRYAYALAITGPVYMFSNMQLGQVFASDAGYHRSTSEYAGARILTGAASLLVCVLLAVGLAGDREGFLVVAVVAAAKMFESFGDVTYGGAQRSGLVHRIAYSGILRGTLIVAFVLLAMRIERNVLLVVSVIAVANLLILPFDMQTLRLSAARERRRVSHAARWPWTFDQRAVRQMLLFALPLGIVAVAVNLISTVPRIALKQVAGLAPLGHFAVLSYFVVGARMVIVPLSNAFISALGAAYVSARKGRFLQLVGLLGVIGIVLGIGGWLVARLAGAWLLTALYGKEYASLAPELALLMIGAGFGYLATFCEDALTAARDLHPKAVLVVVVALLTVAASTVLIRRFGFDGAVYTVVLASATEAIGSAVLLARAIRRPWTAGT